ncbi:cytosolic carboxypeptidase 2 [Patella vulgata]|uniref:cytosolic carboxypeptidase 2 n=1 Tax=Patella vulgata TaxID=6465 RepID=UPI0024A93966|nr:cytosolic carboxypeptidase 2 [Patella vulgata]
MSYNHKSSINRDEVFRLIESKQEKVAKESQLWGPDIIKKQMEDDLARRVREALETPPLERMQRKKERDQKQRQRELQKQNSHLLLRLNSTDNAQFQKWRENKNRLLESPRMAYSSPSPVDYLFRDQLSKSNHDEYPGVFGLENFSEGIKNIRDVYSSTVERFPPIKPRAKHFYTKDGFLQILKNGKLPDGFQVIDDLGNYVDKYGVIRSEHGPFWPTELVPLFPAPKLLDINNLGVEPLYFQLPVAMTTIDKQHSPYSGRWRGMLVVYDSERSQRDHAPQPVPEGCCPNLVFESRFECGNLRQARRVGQYEYELVLRTDLYTNRHTQWYYFRVTNAVPGITYKFRIVNLLKRDSLYNYGMRPLVYSEKDAKEQEIGWRRTGHHISYCNNIVHHTCPLLQRGISYYMLEWQMEFPNSDDTYYLAHCYPYTFTDLKNDLDSILSDPVRQPLINREVMCETRAGNSCFLLTITNPEYTMCKRKKKYVVITARVHPGETQASWMMRGLLYFITSNDATAQELRNNCIFKIVPMINPDGVIVGNYRCSLAARDLNRNYRHPKRENFPTIFTIKNMIDDLLNKNEVVLYCDLHGHSRKQNVFMYGNNKIIDQDSPTGVDAAQSFIAERLFPWLMAVKSPEKFSFKSCKFQIKRCKESTGRVVMWRQMKIPNSFTLEATFSGTILDKTSCRHFNCRDYEDMGKTLCEVVLDYQNMQENKDYQMEVVMDLTRAITHQILANRGLVPKHVQLTDVQSDKVFDSGISVEGSDMSSGSQTDTEKISEITTELVTNQKSALVINNNRQFDNKSKERKSSNKENKLLTQNNSSVVKSSSKGDNYNDINLQKIIDMSSMKSLDGCLNLLAELNVCQAVLESDSSDSDSESEPELKPPEIKQRKKKRKSRKQRDRENKKLLNERRNSDNSKKPSSSTGSERLQKVNNCIYMHYVTV